MGAEKQFKLGVNLHQLQCVYNKQNEHVVNDSPCWHWENKRA